jgi:hypothetical protein
MVAFQAIFQPKKNAVNSSQFSLRVLIQQGATNGGSGKLTINN